MQQQDQADWFEKRDVDCKVLSQKNVYDIAIIVTSGELYTEKQTEIFTQLDQVINQLSLKK